MPKRTYKIQGFHGGMNTNADSRDVTDIESPSLQDVKISNIGTIKTLGSVADTSTSNTLQILPNRGLFSMDADRKVSDNGLRDETLIIVYDDGGNSFDVKDSNAWATAEISLNTSHPVFYSSDGILRVGDGALSQNGQWYGYISGAKFDAEADFEVRLPPAPPKPSENIEKPREIFEKTNFIFFSKKN